MMNYGKIDHFYNFFDDALQLIMYLKTKKKNIQVQNI